VTGVGVARMFRAFSDRTRLRILHLLKDHREVCVGDLVAVLEAPQTTVSRHLAYLRRSGLVQVRKDGLWKHYSLAAPASRLHRALLRCLPWCFEEVRELAADRRSLERLKGCCPLQSLTADARTRYRCR
jgi:ArsR family transcriptional regulator, arsenate/arsenite/antimonite-responsive transcriptional repressor